MGYIENVHIHGKHGILILDSHGRKKLIKPDDSTPKIRGTCSRHIWGMQKIGHSRQLALGSELQGMHIENKCF